MASRLSPQPAPHTQPITGIRRQTRNRWSACGGPSATVTGVAAEQAERLSPWIRMFQIMAISEAITWAGLLIGMLFKYVVASDAVGVKIFGPLHGMVMIFY